MSKITNRDQYPKGLGLWTNIILFIGFLLIVALWFSTPYFIHLYGNRILTTFGVDSAPLQPAKAGQFGDQFGAANALFAALSTFFLIITLLMQRQELGYQRDELVYQREEIVKNRGEMELQRQAIQRQVNESTLFQLLGMFRDNAACLSTRSPGYRQPPFSGEAALENFKRRLDTYIQTKVKNIDETVRQQHYEEFWKQDVGVERWKSLVDVFLAMVSFITRAEISDDDRDLYKRLISANASKLEIDMLRLHLFYSGLHGNEELQPIRDLGILCHG